MNDAEWEEAVDILDWHYREEMKNEELDNLRDDIEFYSDWVDSANKCIQTLEETIDIKDRKIEELEERIEYQRKVIYSLRNKNSQLIGDIRELLDERENQWLHCC